MPCPTCDHTMHNLGVESQRIFWCPRCGTIKTEVDEQHHVISLPRLCHVAIELTTIIMGSNYHLNPEQSLDCDIKLAEACGMLSAVRAFAPPPTGEAT